VPHLALAWLALRRALPWPLALVLALLFALAARGSGVALAPALDPDGAGLARAAERLDVWSVFFGLALPLLVWRAAWLGRPEQNDWLRPLPAPRGALALALFAGVAAAGALVVAGAVVASELGAGAGGPAWRRAEVWDTPVALLLGPRTAVHWTEPALAGAPRGTRLSLAVTVAPGAGPAATARFTAAGGSVEARVSGRRRLVLELPADTGAAPLELALERVGEGAALVLLPDGLERLEPVASERAVSLALGAHALALVVAAGALALGLARALRPALAALSVLALIVLAQLVSPGAAPVPAGDLAGLWSEVASGLAPHAPGAGAAAGALACAAVGVLLCRSGLGTGGRA